MSTKTQCTPRNSAIVTARRETGFSLDTFLNGKAHRGEFFDEDYFTEGLVTLVDRAFPHVSGTGAGSLVFLLSRAMSGGKIHSKVGLGLLARDPELRRKVLADKVPATRLSRCCAVWVNGRSIDARGRILGFSAEPKECRQEVKALATRVDH